MKRPHTTVIIPALNEEQSIARVVRDLPKHLVDEVIVVDNGSTDQTAIRAEKAGAFVVHEHRKGYGWACLAGIKRAFETDCQILVFMDGDYSDFPEEISRIVEPIINGEVSMVIGSRVLGRPEKGSLTPQQRFGNWLATRLMRLFYGVRYTDLGPFRAITRTAIEKLKMSDKTYGWTIEMQLKAAKLKVPSKEVPVSYRKRIGTSKVSGTIKGSVLAGIKIIFAIFKYLFYR